MNVPIKMSNSYLWEETTIDGSVGINGNFRRVGVRGKQRCKGDVVTSHVNFAGYFDILDLWEQNNVWTSLSASPALHLHCDIMAKEDSWGDRWLIVQTSARRNRRFGLSDVVDVEKILLQRHEPYLLCYLCDQWRFNWLALGSSSRRRFGTYVCWWIERTFLQFVSTPLNWYDTGTHDMESHRISTYVGISTRFSTNLHQMSFGWYLGVPMLAV